MNYAKFNYMAYGLALAMACASAACNWMLDPYGLFHHQLGRTRTVYGNERTAKYLMACSYIPENFDGLLIGSSVSLNWDTSQVHGPVLYNASLDGGNISEGKLIADRVFQRRPPRLLVMVIYPYLTRFYGRAFADTMQEREFWGALGSHQLILSYASALAVKAGLRGRTANAYGWKVEDMPAWSPARPVDLAEERLKFHVDERAVAEYQALLETARRAGTRIVGVIPPVAPFFWSFERGQFEAYRRRILPLFHVDELIIDFTAPEFASKWDAPGAFPDGIHVSPRKAEELVTLLEAKLRTMTVA